MLLILLLLPLLLIQAKMWKTINFNSQFYLPKHFNLHKPIGKTIICYPQSTNLASRSYLYHSTLLLSQKAQIQKHIICARRSKRGFGYSKLRRILPKVLSFMASNAKILPEPLDFVIGELGGGDGGGLGFWNGFRGESFDGWGKNGKRNFGFLVACGLVMVVVVFGRELKSDVLFGVSALALFLGVFCTKGFKRKVKDLGFWICFVVASVCLGLRREDVIKLIERVRVSSPVLKHMKKKRKNGRRFA